MVEGAIDYANHFWGEKHHGYHVLYDHLKQDEDAVQEFAQFVKERVNFEEECSKFYAKCLGRTNVLSNSGGAFSNAWIVTKNTIELLYEIQKSLVISLQQLLKDVVKYHEDLVRSRKRMKDHEVVDAVNLMQTTTTCLQKAKETYTQRGSEIERLRKDNATPKELFKAENKLMKSRDEYKSYVEKYGRVRENFEDKMIGATRSFQLHDNEVLQQMKLFLSHFAGLIDESAIATSRVYCQYRSSVSNINIEEIMAKFVETMGTGTKRPEPVEFEPIDVITDNSLLVNISAPSSSNSSGTTLSNQMENSSSAPNESLDVEVNKFGACNENSASNKSQPSPVPSDSSSSTTNTATQQNQFSASHGRQKLSLWLPGKRKKYASQSSLSTSDLPQNDFNQSQPESLGFLKKYRSKNRKSTLDLTAATAETINVDDVEPESVVNTDEKTEANKIESTSAVVPPPVPDVPPPMDTDDEDEHKSERTPYIDKSRWSSCTESSEEDEEVIKAAKLKSISIKPLNESTKKINASVDELRDAVGNIVINGSLNRSSTFESDPWTATTRTRFSASLGGNVLPLRAALTGDDYLRKKRADSYNERSLPFSASICGGSIARARPHSSTPTPGTSSMASHMYSGHSSNSLFARIDSIGSDQLFARSGSADSLDQCGNPDSPFLFSTQNLQKTVVNVNENRVPFGIAINEYVHAWFKGADCTKVTVRVFGTVFISLPVSSLPSLADQNLVTEPLKLKITNAAKVKTILPNKLLVSQVGDEFQFSHFAYQFDMDQLAKWLCDQKAEQPDTQFFNTEVLRYELKESEPPPLFITAFWKLEDQNTDLRIDYRLNNDSSIQNALLNVAFTSTVNGSVANVIADPKAEWLSSTNSITWRFTELSRHGDCSGSLKARLSLSNGPTTAAKTFAHFQATDASISGIDVSLATENFYHLSLIRRKVFSGKYFCDAEIRD